MIVDCHTCTVRDIACGDCVVTMLLGPVDMETDRGVLAVLADAGLVKPLRLVAPQVPGKGADRGAAAAG